MKKSILFASILLMTLLVFSCQKVIQLDLNKMDQKYVIEGFITKDASTHQVKITKTLDFDQNTTYPTVDNATVIVSDNFGNTATFTLVAPGIYETNGFAGVPGRKYTITVTIGDEIFTAASTMPNEILLTGIDVLDIPFGQEVFKVIVPKRGDEAGIENFYFYNIFLNGKRQSGIALQDDKNSDGLVNEEPLFIGDLASNDTVRVIMHCIDKPVYKYLYSIAANTGSIASPANPDSNFGSTCLGYFSARVSSEKTIVIP